MEEGKNPSVQPTAPVEYQMDPESLRPPSYEVAMTQDENARRNALSSLPSITDDQARTALGDFVSTKCCYGKGPVREMSILDLTQSSVFHYKLESYTEKRSTEYVDVPYVDGPIDGPEMGAPPQPWDIPAYPSSAPFAPCQKMLEVPHTSSVRPCMPCGGRGSKNCSVCIGSGRTTCSWCSGSGQTFKHGHHDPHHHNHHHDPHHHGHHHDPHHHGHHHHHSDGHHERCNWCHGTGHSICHVCSGRGFTTCDQCNGRGLVRRFVRLTVRWETHESEFLDRGVNVAGANVPDDQLRSSNGRQLLEETQARLAPLDPLYFVAAAAAAQASVRLLQEHTATYASVSKLISQRHSLSAIPCATVKARYKNKEFDYSVFGFESSVWAPDYPAKCCCTLL